MKNLSGDSEKAQKSFLLRSRVGGCLEALMEPLPASSDKDLQVVHRKTEKGLWKDELWTKRDFEALELQLAPVSSQLKDRNLMAAGHVAVGLPKHGRGGGILTTPPWPLMVEEGPPWLRRAALILRITLDPSSGWFAEPRRTRRPTWRPTV